MSPTTGTQIEELRDAIVGAFSEDALVQMVRFNLEKDLFKIVPRGALSTVAFTLITLAEQEGWTRALVTAVAQVRSGNEAVQRFCRDHAPWALAPPNPQDMIGAVTDGAQALARGGADAQARAIIATFQVELQGGLREFDALHRYKALHDRLHTLEFRYFRDVRTAVEPAAPGGRPRFRDDEEQFLALQRYCTLLRREVAAARADASGLRVRALEDDWIDDYDRAVTYLSAALEGPDDKLARRAVEILKGLFGQASRLNSNMALCAGNLPLGRLTEALRQIIGGLPGSTHQLIKGLQSLQALDPRLQGLIQEHCEWQRLDREFAAAADLPGVTLGETFPHWPRVRGGVMRLCDLAREQPWAVQLRQTVDVLEATTDSVAFRRTFQKFRDLAGEQFYVVDQEMHRLSGHLVEVAQPLAHLLIPNPIDP
ncbi:hypothetical protein VT84_12585 [Gemmata sp. SH-PL17]|uniref:effector-associated domain EAD1-containing protein n=1 Tax=Gemmata sp. SH-PL17 TaxID=1630693 RepID=UPI00078C3E77|nr:effector-associated domain EAD1-containing protein [Gemmata sp. SH-PL17]AMV25228.1 hypothetical protein VT84_12585 [Gemmata sp. SH-PL17]